MDSILSTWLRLREPADAAARSASLARAVAEAVSGADPVRVVDLGTGTGSNVRYLAPHLPHDQRWLAVDRDDALLELAPAVTASWAAARGWQTIRVAGGFLIRGDALECRVETRQADLGTLDHGLFEERHLVTASALLDLTSERWLRALADRCCAAGAAALFAITYNGWSACTPAEPEDEMVRDLLNRHQRTDKGLGGPAAGPEAAECAAGSFRDAGYEVRCERSDWRLDTPERELQRQLIDGWAEAAVQIAPGERAAIADWRMRRIAHLDTNRSRIVVGHVDIAAWPRRSTTLGTQVPN